MNNNTVETTTQTQQAQTQNETLDEVRATMTVLKMTAKQVGGNVVKTLKAEDYKASDCFTNADLNKIAKTVDLPNIMANGQYLQNTLGKHLLVTYDSGVKFPVMIEQIMHMATGNRMLTKAVQVCIEAHQAQDRLSDLISGRGGFPLKLSELEISGQDLLRSFGLTDASTVEVIEIDPKDYDMHQFYGDEIVNSTTYRHILKVKQYGEEEGYSHLAVNVHSIHTVRLRASSYRCSKKMSGCGRGNLGLKKVSAANGCPHCGNSRSNLTKQGVCFDLPQVVNGKLSASMSGDVKFTRVKIEDQKLANKMLAAQKRGHCAIDMVQSLLNSSRLKAYTRKMTDKSDGWYAVSLRPVCFDMNGTPYLGLAVDMSNLVGGDSPQ